MDIFEFSALIRRVIYTCMLIVAIPFPFLAYAQPVENGVNYLNTTIN